MTAESICPLYDLPASMCSHCRGHDQPDLFPIRWEGSQTEALWPGSCAHCGDRFGEGVEIVQADINENGTDGGWCLLEHTRAAGGLMY